MESKKKAVVATIIDEYNVVLNRGTKNGVQIGDHYQLYYLSDEDIIDPETNTSLGKLEYIIGMGKVINVQDTMCTLESCDFDKESTVKKITKSNPYTNIFLNNSTTTEEIIEPPKKKPFENVKKGILARLIE